MAPTSTQRHVKTTGWLSWAMLAALAGVVAVQLVFARWAYLAYKHGEVRCAPAHPNCLSLHLYGPPLFDMPAWGHVIAWFVVDLALLLLGLWRLARLVGWRRRTLRWAAPAAAVALAISMSLGYWWAVAYASGSHMSCSEMHLDRTLLAHCNRVVARMSWWENISSGYVFLIWASLAVIACGGIWLARRRRGALATPQPS